MPFNNAGLNTVVNNIANLATHIGLLNSSTVELTGGSPAYARQPVTWANTSDGVMANANILSFNLPAGADIQSISGYDSETGGAEVFSHACTYEATAVQAKYVIAVNNIYVVANNE